MFKDRHFPTPVILTCIRWYLRYNLSYRDLEEMMAGRGVHVDHATINRWVVKFFPMLAWEARRHKKSVGKSWRMDETCIKVRGQWRYLYRAVDKQGQAVDFLLAAKRDTDVAPRFQRRAVDASGVPDQLSRVNIDKSGADKAGIEAYNDEAKTSIEIRQCKYLNKIVEQDPLVERGLWAVKQKMVAALGFQTFNTAKDTLTGLELVHRMRKGQIRSLANGSNAYQFNALAALRCAAQGRATGEGGLSSQKLCDGTEIYDSP